MMETATEDPSIPVVDAWYEARGYTFRVDFVDNGQVYYVRWPIGVGNDEYGDARRCKIEDWAASMKIAVDAKVIAAPSLSGMAE